MRIATDTKTTVRAPRDEGYVPVYRYGESPAPRPGQEPGGDLPALPDGRAHHTLRGAALRGSAAASPEARGRRVPVRRVPFPDLPALHGARVRRSAHRALAAVQRGRTGAREVQLHL